MNAYQNKQIELLSQRFGVPFLREDTSKGCVIYATFPNKVRVAIKHNTVVQIDAQHMYRCRLMELITDMITDAGHQHPERYTDHLVHGHPSKWGKKMAECFSALDEMVNQKYSKSLMSAREIIEYDGPTTGLIE